MKVVWASLAVLAFASCVQGQVARRIGDDQPLRSPVSTLSAQERYAVTQAVQPAINRWLERFGDEDKEEISQDVLSIQQSLRYERRDGLILVQAYNVEGCGAVGNCQFFLLNNKHQLLLSNVVAYFLTIFQSSHNGLPDVLLGEHISAGQTAQRWYRFNGSHYRAIRCAVDTYGLPYKDNKRHREFGPCRD